jgi:hypothetical protein
MSAFTMTVRAVPGTASDTLRREADDDEGRLSRIDDRQHGLAGAGRRDLQVEKFEVKQEEIVRPHGPR